MKHHMGLTILRPHDLHDIVGSFKALPSFDRCMKQSITTLSIFNSNRIIDHLFVKVSNNCDLTVDLLVGGVPRCASDLQDVVLFSTGKSTCNTRKQVDKIKPLQEYA